MADPANEAYVKSVIDKVYKSYGKREAKLKTTLRKLTGVKFNGKSATSHENLINGLYNLINLPQYQNNDGVKFSKANGISFADWAEQNPVENFADELANDADAYAWAWVKADMAAMEEAAKPDPVQQAAYSAAKQAGKTELTFTQWTQVRTPEFKAWFGDWENDPENASKVINPRTGEPLVVYHGTPDVFTVFSQEGLNTSSAKSGAGFFFTPDLVVAKTYMSWRDFKRRNEPSKNFNPMELFLNIRELSVSDFEGNQWDNLPNPPKYGVDNTQDLSAYARKNGFDGTRFDNVVDSATDNANKTAKPTTVFTVFEPTNIKSAINNNGKFDPNNRDIRFSRSAMKDTQANIRRGHEAMNRAILQKADVKRAMYRQGLGWVDFVWGSAGTRKANGKTRGAMGLAHILEARQRKDGMSYADTVKMLTENVVETIAKGEIKRELQSADGKNINLQIDFNGNRTVLTRRNGSNAWIVTSFELYQDGASGVGFDTSTATHTKPTLTRQSMGASDTSLNVRSPADVVKFQTALDNALGRLAERVQLVRDVKAELPKYAEQVLSDKYDGAFDSKSGKVYLFAQNIKDAVRAVFVAWHELGHRGFARGEFRNYRSELRQFGKHSVVSKLADAIVYDRRDAKDDPVHQSRDLALEEALQELYAASKTGEWDKLETRYSVKIPNVARRRADGMIARVLDKIRVFLKRVFGHEYSDAELVGLLRDLNRDVVGDFEADTSQGDVLFSKQGDEADKVAHVVKRMGLVARRDSSRILSEGKRDAVNAEIERQFLNPFNAELNRLAKKYGKHSLIELKKMVGYWASARYAPTANARLIKQAEQAVRDKEAENSAESGALKTRPTMEAELEKLRADLQTLRNAVAGKTKGKVAGGYSNPMAAEVKANISPWIV